jgi:hypothetical protein
VLNCCRLSDQTDLKVKYMVPNPTLFPDVPTGILLHSGFALEHQKTAPQILTEVKRLMVDHSSTHVILVRRRCCYASEDVPIPLII